jgi:fructose-bisphosphate aldolase class II
MPLISTKPMFERALAERFAVGAFNVNNMEIIQGIADAAAAKKIPLILQISKGARSYARIEYLRHLIDATLEVYPDLPIAMHLDHGDTFELAAQCVDDGFTSVMIDGSHLPLAENIALTKKVVQYAHPRGVMVEGELGRLAGVEEHVSVSEKDAIFTNPDEAVKFVEASGVDSLAVAIGTSHGAYKFAGEPYLDFERLERIQEKLPGYFLVLHGASSVIPEFVAMCNQYGGKLPNARGVPEDMIGRAAKDFNIVKINIDTDLRLALTAVIRKEFAEDPKNFDPRKYLGPARDAIQKMVERKIDVLGMAGKGVGLA